MEIKRIAVDTSKAVFTVHGLIWRIVRFFGAISAVQRLSCGFQRKPPTYSDLMPPPVLT